MVLICCGRRRTVGHSMLPRRVVLPWYPHGGRSAISRWLRKGTCPVVATLRLLLTEFRENRPDCSPGALLVWIGRVPLCVTLPPAATATAATVRGSVPRTRLRASVSSGTSSEASFQMLLRISGGATPFSIY